MTEHDEIINVSFCNRSCPKTESCPLKKIQARKARGGSAIEEALALQSRRRVTMSDQFQGRKPRSEGSQVHVGCTKDQHTKGKGHMTIAAEYYSR